MEQKLYTLGMFPLGLGYCGVGPILEEEEESMLVKYNTGGQVSYSTTKPGITRGNHFHTRKIERFAVIQGKALIKMRKYGTDQIINLELNGDEPSFVDMPVWYTHNITNIGEDELVTLFWINEIYDPADADTYYEQI